MPLNIGVKATPTLPQPARDLLSQVKVNFNTARHNMFVRYAGEHGYLDNSFGNNGSAMLDYAERLERNNQELVNLSSGWSWIMNPRIVNQFTVQLLSWTHDNVYPDCPLPQGCLEQRLVFPSVSTGPVSGGGFPHWYNFEDKWQIRNDTSIQSGRHGWKFGVDYAWMPKNGGIYGPGSPGSIAFFDDPSVILSNSNGRYPQGLQTPGIVRSISITGTPIGDYDSYDNWSFSTYVQDDWRLAPRLTLNLGLRYDLYQLMNQGNDAFAANRTYQVLKAIGNPYGELPKTDTDNFGPRVGMAWDVRGDGERVVRASYGRYYTLGIKNSYYLAAIQDKPTLFLTQQRTNSAIGVGGARRFRLRGFTAAAGADEHHRIPARRQQRRRLVRSQPQGLPDRPVRRRLLARAGAEHGRVGRLLAVQRKQRVADDKHQPVAAEPREPHRCPHPSAGRRSPARVQRSGADGPGEPHLVGQRRHLRRDDPALREAFHLVDGDTDRLRARVRARDGRRDRRKRSPGVLRSHKRRARPGVTSTRRGSTVRATSTNVTASRSAACCR